MNSHEKLCQLHLLGKERGKSQPIARSGTFVCYPLHRFQDGLFAKKTEFVSPITNAAHDVDSPIVFVLQDWASSDDLESPKTKARADQIAQLGYDPDAPTNKRLQLLIKKYMNMKYEDVFITNLFPHIKKGGLSGNIPQGYLDDGFELFCSKEIRIVKPEVVVCLGVRVYETFRKKLRGEKNSTVFRSEDLGCLIYKQYHPGARISEIRMGQSWKQMMKSIGSPQK